MKRVIMLTLLGTIALAGCGGNSSSAPTSGNGAASAATATNGSQFGNATFGSAKF